MTTPAPKPSLVSGWHPTNPALIVEPNNTDKANGYTGDDVPPAEYFNFEFDLGSQYQEWLRDIWRWANFEDVGVSKLATFANALLARYRFPTAVAATSVRTRIFQFGLFGGAQVAIWTYNADDVTQVFELTLNAEFTTGGTWDRVTSGQKSRILRFGYDGVFRLAWRDDGAADHWADSYAGSAGAGTGWTTYAQIGVTSATLPGSTTVKGTLTAEGNVVADNVLSNGSVIGDSFSGPGGTALVVPNDLTAGGDATVDDLFADDLHVDAVNATGPVNADSGDFTNDVSVGGEISAGSGLMTTEVSWSFVDFSNIAPVNAFAVPYLASIAGERVYRLRDGHVRRWGFWLDAIPASGKSVVCKLYRSSGGVPVLVDTLTIDDTAIEARTWSTPLSAPYLQGDFFYVEVHGSGGSFGAPLDVSALVSFQE